MKISPIVMFIFLLMSAGCFIINKEIAAFAYLIIANVYATKFIDK